MLESLRIAVVVVSGALLIAAAGCSVSPDQQVGEETGETEGAFTGTRSVDLKYEGTCDFLRSCSSYSRNLPEGEVMWGCTGLGACSDSGLWVAGPNRSFCGKTVSICKGGRCTNALVKDISITQDWEASNGVLDALNLPHGLTGRCGGYGGGGVTVTVGGRTPSSAPAEGPEGCVGKSDGWYCSARDVSAAYMCQNQWVSRSWQCADQTVCRSNAEGRATLYGSSPGCFRTGR